MTVKTDRERAIYFEGAMHEAQANCEWLREQLAEAHRIIGILVAEKPPAGVVPSLGKSFPGLHPGGKAPGRKRLEEWKAMVSRASGEGSNGNDNP